MYIYPIRGMGTLHFDWTILLIIGAFVLSLAVQGAMQSTFRKYGTVPSMRGMTGAQVAAYILQSEGLWQVRVQQVSGSLTDHYDPKKNVVSLSQTVYGSTSIAALGVAAHECGHAMQHARGYRPLAMRTALVPVANIGSRLSWPLFLFGLIFSWGILIKIGIILFCFALAFQLITLPVEFNASRNALKKLQSTGLVGEQELAGTKKVLGAAAMTYVAAVVTSLMYLARMLALGGRRRG